MKTTNYTQLRANMKRYIDSVIDDGETVVINRGRGGEAVLISREAYNSLKQTACSGNPSCLTDTAEGPVKTA